MCFQGSYGFGTFRRAFVVFPKPTILRARPLETATGRVWTLNATPRMPLRKRHSQKVVSLKLIAVLKIHKDLGLKYGRIIDKTSNLFRWLKYQFEYLLTAKTRHKWPIKWCFNHCLLCSSLSLADADAALFQALQYIKVWNKHPVCLWVLELHLTRCCWCIRARLIFSQWREKTAEMQCLML